MLILWILLAVAAAAAFFFADRDAGDSARMLRVLGVLLAIAAIVVFVIWLVGVLDTNTDVDTGMVFGLGVARLRRMREWLLDELRALIYDVQALGSRPKIVYVSARSRREADQEWLALQAERARRNPAALTDPSVPRYS